MRYVEKNMTTGAVLKVQAELNSYKKYSDCTSLKNLLRDIYQGCCAYCEQSPESTSFPHCDHFYYKKEFIHFRKAIENLHYSCQRCNMLKLDKSSEGIFSPNLFLDNSGKWQCTDPDKIEKELFYKGHLLFAKNLKPGSVDRGKNTIELFDLNASSSRGRSSRKAMVEDRIRLFKLVSKQIEFILILLSDYNLKFNHLIEDLFSQLVEHTRPGRPFSTMIIHNFGNDLIKLLEVYLKLKKKK